MLTPSQLAERRSGSCARGTPNCRLHFTRGTPPEHPVSADAAWDAESFRRQREKNRAYYQKKPSAKPSDNSTKIGKVVVNKMP